MMSYDQDEYSLRWGFDPFHDPLFSNTGYCGASMQAADSSSFFDGYYPSDDRQQQQLEQLRETMFPQDHWLEPSHGVMLPLREATHGVEPCSGSCSPRESSYEEEEKWPLDIVVDDFSDIDGEVGKRLNQMIPVPHVQKINGTIPSVEEAISDHQRLKHRLRIYDLVELKVQGDGNCQFRALSDQFYRSPEHHKFVRQQVINQLESHPELYEGYVPMAYNDYLQKLSKNAEWGDHVTLQAAADLYGVRIFVVTSFKDTCYIEILPNIQKSNRVIFLSFWAEVHYNSIYPEGDLPLSTGTKKKKKWWRFGGRHH